MPFGCSGSIPARACGGTQSGPVPVLTIRGLSPRVAGEPFGLLRRFVDFRVYPRACGGTPEDSAA